NAGHDSETYRFEHLQHGEYSKRVYRSGCQGHLLPSMEGWLQGNHSLQGRRARGNTAYKRRGCKPKGGRRKEGPKIRTPKGAHWSDVKDEVAAGKLVRHGKQERRRHYSRDIRYSWEIGGRRKGRRRGDRETHQLVSPARRKHGGSNSHSPGNPRERCGLGQRKAAPLSARRSRKS